MQVCPELLFEQLKGSQLLVNADGTSPQPHQCETGPKQTQTKNECSQEMRRVWDEERGYFDVVTWTPELSDYINCKILGFLLLKLSQCELSTYYSKPRVSTNRTSSYVLIEFSDVICVSLCSVYRDEPPRLAVSTKLTGPVASLSSFHCFPAASYIYLFIFNGAHLSPA